MSLYGYILLFSGLIPFLYSFEKKLSFYKKWPILFLSILIVLIPYIIWDIYFTQNGFWGFNEKYIGDFSLFHLPIEEILFFVVIPYVCVFTFYALRFYFPKFQLPLTLVRILSFGVLGVILWILLAYYNHIYTRINSFFLIITLGLTVYKKPHILQYYYWVFMVILVPFFIVNGLLTGMMITEEVVWYNEKAFLGFRWVTIPLEDVFYAFSLILANVYLVEFFGETFTNKKRKT